MTQPIAIASSASGSESAGTRAAPATMTRRETPRFPQRRPVSSVPRTRSRSGTGSIPQLPGSRSCSIAVRAYRRACRRMQPVIPRYFVIAESAHELQNPTSKEKIVQVGREHRPRPGVARPRHRVGPRRPCALPRERVRMRDRGDRGLAGLPRRGGEAHRGSGSRRPGLVPGRGRLAGDASRRGVRRGASVSARASSGEVSPGRSTRSSRRSARAAMSWSGSRTGAACRFPTTTRNGACPSRRSREPWTSSRAAASSSPRWSCRRTTTGTATRPSTGAPWSGGSRRTPSDPDAGDVRAASRAGEARTTCATAASYLGWAIFVGWKPHGAP